MPAKTRSRARHSDQLPESPRPSEISVAFMSVRRRGTSPGRRPDTDDATGSEFVPEEKTTSPDSDDEFSLQPLDPSKFRRNGHRRESTPPHRSRPFRAVVVPRENISSEVALEVGPSSQVAFCGGILARHDARQLGWLDLEERQLPGWAIPEHIPDFTIRRDPTIMETFKDPSLVECRLEDSPPEVFGNPAYLISERGKWLQKLANGDHSVERYCRLYTAMRVRLLTFLYKFPAPLDPADLPADPNDPYYNYPNPKPSGRLS
ncbi:hypothetical protein B0H14DRAFT_3540583 [Mycena olivaceomarginata]|nr:hypothetical protein B0H14DRAFT_3540583 [Mycena olivaceomarginata]